MARQVYILPSGTRLTADVLATARAVFNHPPFTSGEVVVGIPPALVGIVTPDMLPYLYTEPTPAPGVKPRDLEAELDALKTRLLVVESKVAL